MSATASPRAGAGLQLGREQPRVTTDSILGKSGLDWVLGGLTHTRSLMFQCSFQSCSRLLRPRLVSLSYVFCFLLFLR